MKSLCRGWMDWTDGSYPLDCYNCHKYSSFSTQRSLGACTKCTQSSYLSQISQIIFVEKKCHVELPKPDNQQLLMGTRMFEMINLSMPYCRKDVQVSVMCSIKASSNFSCSYLSTWWTCGLKKSSLGFLLALPDSGFLFCP